MSWIKHLKSFYTLSRVPSNIQMLFGKEFQTANSMLTALYIICIFTVQDDDE